MNCYTIDLKPRKQAFVFQRHLNQTAFRSNNLAKALNTAEKLSKKKEVFIQLYWINFNKEIKKQHLWVGGKKNGWRCLIPLCLLPFFAVASPRGGSGKGLNFNYTFPHRNCTISHCGREFTRRSGAASGTRYVIRRDSFVQRPQRAVSEAISVTEPPPPPIPL